MKVDDAIAFLQGQVDTKATGWHNECEHLCRAAYGLPAHYASANLHYEAIPAEHRFGKEMPSCGDLAVFKNNGAGHIVVCTGNGWGAYTNDFPIDDRVSLIDDLRVLTSWCHATDWYIADAWWSDTSFLPTHNGDNMPTAEEIAKATWDAKTKDPQTGETISQRELALRTLTVARQAKAAAIAAAASAGDPSAGNLTADMVADELAQRLQS